MYNELTEVDIRKMQEEIDYRVKVVRPKCVEDVATAAAFGDRSENYEYKAAKQELRRCDSRLRYLKKMIATAKVIQADAREGVAGLFDRVEIEYEDEGDTETITLMTTLREDAVNGIISKESPLGRAVMGRRVGETATVKVNEEVSYTIRILKIEKGSDDETETITLMTTLREDAVNGIISKESPLGRAVMGRRVGDRVVVKVNDEVSYPVVIRSIRKGEDDDSLPISRF